MSCGHKITTYRGDTPKLEFTILNCDDEPLDLTTATVRFSAKINLNEVSYIFDRTCTIIDPLKGTCEIRLTSAETNVIVESGIAELSVEYPADNVILTIEQFQLEIKNDVRK